MKYVNPEMEIVELDDSILTTQAGLTSNNELEGSEDGFNFSNPNTGV